MSIFTKIRELREDAIVETQIEESFSKVARKKRAHRYHSRGETKKAVLEFVMNRQGVTANVICKRSKLAHSSVYTALTDLVAEGKLTRTGKGRGTVVRYYTLKPPVATTPETEKDANKTGKMVRYEHDILAFAEANPGKRYSLAQMADAVEVPVGSVYPVVYKLQKEGKLAKDFNLGKTLIEPVEPESQPVPPKKDHTLIDNMEFLIWQFVKETRSTDVIQFLTWLEKR